MADKEVEELAYEAACLLKMDRELLLVYAKMITIARPFAEEEVLGLASDKNRNVIDGLLESGLVIVSGSNYQPVHPRLGFSNLYRLALRKDAEIRTSRGRLDAIISYFVKRWEEALNWTESL